jgi:hypothetical protein
MEEGAEQKNKKKINVPNSRRNIRGRKGKKLEGKRCAEMWKV